MKKIITGMTAIALSFAMASFASAGLFGCGACDVVGDDCNACDDDCGNGDDCNPCESDCGTGCGRTAGGINFWAVTGGYAQNNYIGGTGPAHQIQVSGFGLTVGADKKFGKTNLGFGVAYTNEGVDSIGGSTGLLADYLDYESMGMFTYLKRDMGRRLSLYGELGYRLGDMKAKDGYGTATLDQLDTSTVIAKLGADFKMIKRRRFEGSVYGLYSWYNLYTDAPYATPPTAFLNVNQLTLGMKGSYKVASNLALNGVLGYDYMDASTRVLRGFGGTPIIDSASYGTAVDTNSTFFGGFDTKWKISKCATLIAGYEVSLGANDYWMQTGFGGIEMKW